MILQKKFIFPLNTITGLPFKHSKQVRELKQNTIAGEGGGYVPECKAIIFPVHKQHLLNEIRLVKPLFQHAFTERICSIQLITI